MLALIAQTTQQVNGFSPDQVMIWIGSATVIVGGLATLVMFLISKAAEVKRKWREEMMEKKVQQIATATSMMATAQNDNPNMPNVPPAMIKQLDNISTGTGDGNVTPPSKL